MTLSIDSVVNAQILVGGPAPQGRGFGTLLFLDAGGTLPLEERIRTFTSSAGVAADTSIGPEAKVAGALYFSQRPRPKTFKVGRRFSAAQSGKLRGSASVSALFSSYTGITNGGFDISLNGVNRQIFGLDFSGAGSMPAIAALIQTKLAAALAGTTCTWTGTYFLITAPTTGPTSLSGFGGAPTGGSSPTDASTILGLTLASGARAIAGIASETMTTSLDASLNFDADWYGVALATTASVQDIKDSMAWAEAHVNIFGYTSNDPNAKVSSDTGNLFFYAKNLSYENTFGQWSNTPYAAVSLMARLFAVDPDQPNSTLTMKFKQEPGVGIETDMTEGDRLTLKAIRANFLGMFGSTPMLAEARMANGDPIDQRWGLDWLQSTVQTALFSPLVTGVTKVPLTDPGVARLVQAGSGGLERGVFNGLLAPGFWGGDDVGRVKNGDFVSKGYDLFAGAVKDLSASDKSARIAPNLTGVALGAGAIEGVNISIIFQQ